MKLFFKYLFLGVVILFSTSCSIQKRHYLPGYQVDWHSNDKVKGNRQENNSNNYSVDKNKADEQISTEEKFAQNVNDDEPLASKNNNTISLKSKKLILKSSDGDSCDVIFLLNGDEINARVMEISNHEIKYKKCNNPDGPVYSTPQSEVFMIKYANGTKDIFNQNTVNTSNRSAVPDTNTYTNTDERKSEGMGILSFILAIAGLVVPAGSILFGLAAIILGIASISKIDKYPKKYLGRGYGILGIILGIIIVVIILAIVAAV